MGNFGIWSIACGFAGCACVAGLAIAVSGACVVAPTTQAPNPPVRRPTIVHTAVDPHADMPLREWPPTGFTVGVLLGDPSDSFVWQVAVDGILTYQGAPNGPIQATPSQFVNGLMNINVPLDAVTSSIDLTQCHGIEMLVGHKYATVTATNSVDPLAFDSIGGDSVWWYYVGAAGPGACGTYYGDAGASGVDASIDILPVPPVEGGGDP
jgi:hypothetical protein